jgi:hypothetical protein
VDHHYVQHLPELAAELVRLNVDVIFAPTSTMVEPARQATKTISIVFSKHADPIGSGQPLRRSSGAEFAITVFALRRRVTVRPLSRSLATNMADAIFLEWNSGRL